MRCSVAGDGIAEGACDCDGNALIDAIGVCGGDCASDADADGICDDVDDCVESSMLAVHCATDLGRFTNADVMDIAEGACDCDGNQLDALGVCGGDCAADADSDGICDDVDDCVGELDACGICNGPGAIYECGCEDILVAIATATATNSTPWACAVETALLTPMPTASVTMWTTASAHSMLVASATVPEPFTIVDVLTSQLATATATETNSTPWVCVVVTALPMPMPMAFVTMWTTVSGALDACGICNGPGAIYECGCSDIPEGRLRL